MPSFDSVEELNKYIENQLLIAMNIVNEKIEEILKKHIEEDFYNAYPNPKVYKRTEDLWKRAPIKIEPKMVGNQIVCGVELDPTQLRQDGIHHGIDRDEIIRMASIGQHGTPEIETEGRFLEQAIQEIFTNQTHLKSLAVALSKAGIWVKLS